MERQIQNIEVKYLAELSRDESDELISSLVPELNQMFIGWDNEQTIAELAEVFEQHRVEHGIAPGAVYIAGKDIAGIGGFQYLEETGLYELMCNVSYGYQAHIPEIINHLVFHAFGNLKMDKICARSLPGTVLDAHLIEYGFTSPGERVFTDDGRDQIWKYYELENEGNLIPAVDAYAYSADDWDILV